jgi:exodeoxyribonuclease V alpha subunit
MVDVPLMAALMKRIDFDKTRLVLVGDHNQLPPVGPGNILRDLLDHQLAPSAILTRVHRQAGLLKQNSCAVLGGKIAPKAGVEHGWIVIDQFKAADQISLYLRDLIRDHIPRRMGYDPLRDVQIITPMHKGPLGTREINKKLQYLFHGAVNEKDKFAIGDKVIQTKNDYALDIMNGTMGFVVERIDKDLIVEFEGVGQKTIDSENVRNLQLAYCLTAHKAEGSEFPCVIVLCHKSHYFADRNWLYTAVTRASKTCILIGDAWGLRRAAGKNLTVQRRTFLGKWADERKEASA